MREKTKARETFEFLMQEAIEIYENDIKIAKEKYQNRYKNARNQFERLITEADKPVYKHSILADL